MSQNNTSHTHSEHSAGHTHKPDISVTESDGVHYIDSNGVTHAAIVKTVHDTNGTVGLHILHKTQTHHDIGTVVHSTDPNARHVWRHKHER